MDERIGLCRCWPLPGWAWPRCLKLWCWLRNRSGSGSGGIKADSRGGSSGSWPRAREWQASALKGPFGSSKKTKKVIIVCLYPLLNALVATMLKILRWVVIGSSNDLLSCYFEKEIFRGVCIDKVKKRFHVLELC
jgi:hypothetical protein